MLHIFFFFYLSFQVPNQVAQGARGHEEKMSLLQAAAPAAAPTEASTEVSTEASIEALAAVPVAAARVMMTIMVT